MGGIPKPRESVVELAGLKLIDSQRPLNHSHPSLVEPYDSALAGYILVSRRADGSEHLIDGQHRSESARRAGETEHLALVYENLTPEQESHLFYKHNTARVGMNSQLKFNAAVQAGYPDAVEIKEIVESVGGRVNKTPNAVGINAVAMLEKIYRYRGPEGLRGVLQFIKDAWPEYHFSVPAASAAVLGGLAYFLALHLDDAGAGDLANYDRFVKKLRHVGPEDIQRRGDGIHSTRKATRESAYYYALVDTYNHGARNGNRINEGRPAWKSVTIKICSVDDCENRAASRGMCGPHYSQWYHARFAKNQGIEPNGDDLPQAA